MRKRFIVSAVTLLLLITIPISGGSNRESSDPSRAVTFIDVGASKFDQISAPTFISAVDWNNDGFTDLLFNGYRLFRNNGPPDWDFTLQTSTFNGSISGSRNGVWADWDGDGDQDLYQGCSKGTADRFWENQGAPNFKLEDVSSEVFGSWQNIHPNTGNAWADLDRDGDLDLYVGNGEDWNDGDYIWYPDYFLRNENGMSFTDASSTVGIRTGENFYSRGVTWGDYNNDHWQDAYVSHYRICENHLFENQRNGTLIEVGQEKNCSGTYANDWYYDATAGSIYGQAWWGPNWGHTIGSSWADFNRDGNLDLWTSDFVHKYVGYYGGSYDIRGYICDDGNLYINDGAPYYTFTDYRNSSGIPKWPIGGQGVYQGDQTFSGVAIGDYDNDGWEDIYIPQVYGDLSYTTPHLYRNKGEVQDPSIPDGTTFEDVTSSLGIEGANTYANLWVDYDNDGDLDLVTGGADTWNSGERKWENYRVRLYQNQGTGSNHWLKVRLNGTGKDPDAVGARVTVSYEVDDDTTWITREVSAGTGHAHQQSNTLHFGLGPSIGGRPMIIDVIWPDGLIQRATSDADRIVSIDKADGEGPEINGYTVSSPIVEDSNVTIAIDASSSDSYIASYIWDLDSDNIIDEVTDWSEPRISIPVHKDGLFHVRCRVRDGNFLGREVYPIEIVVPNTIPVIDLSDRIINMDTRLVIEDIIKDTPSDLANLSWKVDWSDEANSSGSGHIFASHTYTVPGRYQIRIEADDGTDEVTRAAFVDVLNVDPWGWVQPLPNNETEFNEDEPVYFQPVVFDTPSDMGDRSFKWDFGDGNATGWEERGPDWESERHTYTRAGQYKITTYVRDQYGGEAVLLGSVRINNPAPIIEYKYEDDRYQNAKEDREIDVSNREFDYSDTRSDIDDLEFQWDFGDGNVSEWSDRPDMVHTYERSGTYTAICTVKDDDNASDTLDMIIEVENRPPRIDMIDAVEETFEDEPFEVIIHGIDTRSDVASLTYELEFLNGTKFRSHNGSFRFSLGEQGLHEILARVIDDDGDIDEVTFYINILNRAPTGSIGVEKNSYDEDQEIMFMAEDVWDTPGDLPDLAISWDFDDGSLIESGWGTVHTYTRKGRYNVKMTIDDGDVEVVVVKDIIINNPQPIAVISIRSDLTSPGHAENGTVIFAANFSSDNPSDVYSLLYLWDFGDGEEGEGISVIHDYEESGTYDVILQVIDDDGAIGEDHFQLKVSLATTELGPAESDDNSGIIMIVMIAAGSFIVLLLVLGGLLLLKRRQAPPEIPPPPQKGASPLPSGVSQHPPIDPSLPSGAPPKLPPLPPPQSPS